MNHPSDPRGYTKPSNRDQRSKQHEPCQLTSCVPATTLSCNSIHASFFYSFLFNHIMKFEYDQYNSAKVLVGLWNSVETLSSAPTPLQQRHQCLWTQQNHPQHPLGRGQRSSTRSQWKTRDSSRRTLTSDTHPWTERMMNPPPCTTTVNLGTHCKYGTSAHDTWAEWRLWGATESSETHSVLFLKWIMNLFFMRTLHTWKSKKCHLNLLRGKSTAVKL